MGIKTNHSLARTYQLFIHVEKPVKIQVGRLGSFLFPAGNYVYTGSAKKNLPSRVLRHLSRNKKQRWHIDYLLMSDGVEIVDVTLSRLAECYLNRKTRGNIPVPGFGSSDCKKHCGSHLKYQGKRIKPSDETGND